ncbi:MAG: PDZ domain-containing protein [Planctomycetota bacterium]
MRQYLLLLIFIVLASCNTVANNVESKQVFPIEKPSFWTDDYFVQKTVDTSKIDSGVIRAFVDGKWQDYELCSLPKGFVEWRMRAWKELHETGDFLGYLRAHCGCVASYGCLRSDTRLHINNAAKGLDFLPRPDKMDELNKSLGALIEDKAGRRKALEKYYGEFGEYMDATRLVSIELFTDSRFETHTFINQMTNPACSVTYVDFPSYELKVIAQLLHPKNPNLTEYEKQVIRYCNISHSAQHGPRDDMPAVVYYIVEIFDNSPRQQFPGSRIGPKPFFGIGTEPVEGGGLRILSIVADSAAAGSGLKENEIIVEFNGVALNTPDDLRDVIAAAGIGGSVTIKVKAADGSERTVKATIGQRE